MEASDFFDVEIQIAKVESILEILNLCIENDVEAICLLDLLNNEYALISKLINNAIINIKKA